MSASTQGVKSGGKDETVAEKVERKEGRKRLESLAFVMGCLPKAETLETQFSKSESGYNTCERLQEAVDQWKNRLEGTAKLTGNPGKIQGRAKEEMHSNITRSCNGVQ